MTEPVAYLIEQVSLPSKISLSKYVTIDKPDTMSNKKVTFLYTKEQLNPIVKMSLNQYIIFLNWWNEIQTTYGKNFTFMLDQVFNYGNIPEQLDNDESLFIGLINIWEIFDPKHPQDTIEVY